MSLRLAINCPFCKRPMATSAAFAGQMIACPNCRGEFVLNPPGMTPPQTGAAAASPLPPPFHLNSPGGEAAGGTAVAVAAPPLAHVATPANVPAAAQPALVTMPGAPPTATQPPANTARFKAASVQSPTVVPTADGKLPTLQLADADVDPAQAAGGDKAVPLWMASLAVVASTVISVILLVGDPQGSESVSSRRAQARHDLAIYYGSEAVQLRPYQVLLREAQQAHSRGDFATERQRYRQVLALLRAEGRNQYIGLTGTPKDDEELARLLSILLANE